MFLSSGNGKKTLSTGQRFFVFKFYNWSIIYVYGFRSRSDFGDRTAENLLRDDMQKMYEIYGIGGDYDSDF